LTHEDKVPRETDSPLEGRWIRTFGSWSRTVKPILGHVTTDVKRETLSADGYQNFAGPTQVCEVFREDVGALAAQLEAEIMRVRGAYEAGTNERSIFVA